MWSVSDRLVMAPVGMRRRLSVTVLGAFCSAHTRRWSPSSVLLWNRWFSWADVILLVATYGAIAAGVTVGLHRYFTHRSFETTRVVRIVLGILALLALEGPITQWVANHLWHHAHADTDDDLHSPLHGLWHAHTGWIFKDAAANPDAFGVTRALMKDRDIQFLDRLYPLIALLSVVGVGLIGYAYGGWRGAASAILLAGVTRIFLVHHFTWSINRCATRSATNRIGATTPAPTSGSSPGRRWAKPSTGRTTPSRGARSGTAMVERLVVRDHHGPQARRTRPGTSASRRRRSTPPSAWPPRRLQAATRPGPIVRRGV